MNDPAPMSLAEAAAAVRRGRASSLELTRAALARIEAWNPRLNAVIRLDPDRAIKAARAADRARREDEGQGGRGREGCE